MHLHRQLCLISSFSFKPKPLFLSNSPKEMVAVLMIMMATAGILTNRRMCVSYFICILCLNSFGLYLQMSEKTEIGCIACTFVIIGVNYQLFAFKSLILNLVFNLEPDFKHEFKLNI